jgi:hypothetical protein
MTGRRAVRRRAELLLQALPLHASVRPAGLQRKSQQRVAYPVTCVSVAAPGELPQGSIQGSNLSVSQSNSEQLKAPETNSEHLRAPVIRW